MVLEKPGAGKNVRGRRSKYTKGRSLEKRYAQPCLLV